MRGEKRYREERETGGGKRKGKNRGDEGTSMKREKVERQKCFFRLKKPSGEQIKQ